MMPRNAPEPVIVEVIIHRSTLGDKGAHFVSSDGEESHAMWLPKSQVIDIELLGNEVAGKRARLTLPEWLADANGLTAEPHDAGVDDLFSSEGGR